MVRVSEIKDSKTLVRSPDLRGKKPSKQNRSVDNPETANADMTAEGPGTT
jgi:hypothetical protein